VVFKITCKPCVRTSATLHLNVTVHRSQYSCTGCNWTLVLYREQIPKIHRRNALEVFSEAPKSFVLRRCVKEHILQCNHCYLKVYVQEQGLQQEQEGFQQNQEGLQ